MEITREPKTRIGARETGQQASEKNAEERTYKLVKGELSMPMKTGVKQEFGDGHEASLESTEAQNNLHTTDQKD